MLTRTERVLRKLLELSRRGVGGERVNADRKLDELCAKHGIDRTELERDNLDVRTIKLEYHGDHEYKLLVQVVGAVLNTHSPTLLQVGRARTWVLVEAPAAQAVELEVAYAAHLSAMREELAVFLNAYFMRNSIYPASDNPDAEDAEPLTPEQQLDARRARDMAYLLRRTHVRKQLGEG